MTTAPFSYSETCDTFRAATRIARRTGSGSIPLIGNFKTYPVRNRFISEHVLEHCPADIRNGFCHFCLSKFGWAYIANNDPAIISYNFRRNLVQEILALISNFCMKRCYSFFLSISLPFSKIGFSSAIKLGHFDLASVAQCGQRLKAKINANFLAITLFCVRQFNLNIYIPTSARIGGKAPRFWFSIFRYWARKPKVIAALSESKDILSEACWSGEIANGNPIQVPLARPESRSIGEGSFSSRHKPSTNSINGIRMNANFLTYSAAQIGKVEGAWSLAATSRFPSITRNPIYFAAIIPNKINCLRLLAKRASCRVSTIFDAVLVCQKHRLIIGKMRFLCQRNKEVFMRKSQ